jgi:hypothetical protein
MRRKGFPEKWIKQIMATIQGGEVYINVNGNRTPFFRTFQGLRQGDPLSPVLFNLVADTLSTLMTRASSKGMLKGVMYHLILEGITHVQYADDTILMVEGDDTSITHEIYLVLH